MDITFHYYAVLAIARQAGFSADEAQTVATYSQFVDDYTFKIPFPVTDVPDFARVLCSQWKETLLLHPITTGFSSWFDMAQLGLEREQKCILTPFHFMTSARPDTEKREELRVRPDYADSGSLLWGCMEKAREDCLQMAGDQAGRHAVLIRLGLLAHIFADTYAHQDFSGFWGWENYCKLQEVRDNNDDQDISARYHAATYHYFPGIGHTEANHAPDDSHVTFSMALCCYKGDNYHLVKTRNNTEAFLRCAHILLNYFRSCLTLPPLAASSTEWQMLEGRLRQGLLAAGRGRAGCHDVWQQQFTDLEFHYDVKELLKSLIAKDDASADASSMDSIVDMLRDPAVTDMVTTKLSVINDDFYYFNLAARDIRNAYAGEDTPNVLTPEQERQLDDYLQTAHLSPKKPESPPREAPEESLSFVAKPLTDQELCSASSDARGLPE